MLYEWHDHCSIVKQLKWREPAGAHRMLSGECAAAGFLFFQSYWNSVTLQLRSNIRRSQSGGIVLDHNFICGWLHLYVHESVNGMG